MLDLDKAAKAIDNLTTEVGKIRADGGVPLKHEFDLESTAYLAGGMFVAVFFAVVLALTIYGNRFSRKP